MPLRYRSRAVNRRLHLWCLKQLVCEAGKLLCVSSIVDLKWALMLIFVSWTACRIYQIIFQDSGRNLWAVFEKYISQAHVAKQQNLHTIKSCSIVHREMEPPRKLAERRWWYGHCGTAMLIALYVVRSSNCQKTRLTLLTLYTISKVCNTKLQKVKFYITTVRNVPRPLKYSQQSVRSGNTTVSWDHGREHLKSDRTHL
jgi:hypothetical protein